MSTAAPTFAAVRPDKPPARALYPHAQWYFFAAMVLTWLGFAHSYFAVVRSEPLLHHIHGALMGGWIALLIVQPILYQRGQLRLHRTLGRWGVYLWVPAIVVCGFLMDRRMLRLHNAPASAIDQLAFLDLVSLLLFPSLIVLSILYARNLQLHARYIVCTVLLFMPPAVARALFILPFMRTSLQINGNVAMALVVVTFLILIADDKRRGHIWLPYPAMAAVFALMAVLSNFVRDWAWWHTLSGWISGLPA